MDAGGRAVILFRDLAALEARRALVRGPLAPLADSLAAELAPWHQRPPAIDVRKARLTRQGGRCAADQTVLTFDPASPHRHRCPRCGRWWTGDDHDGYWVYGYHLWWAERATHAALLFALRGNAAHQALAAHMLRAAAAQYAQWPNRDNVLGPSRPFFSTYLESLWLLQLAEALSLLELVDGADDDLRSAVRTGLLAPSRALIASYPEGDSNRQAWNSSAIAAASLLLGDRAAAERAIAGPDGIAGLLERGLLSDGSWYEGENYHQFAWRGLWFGVQIAEHAGIALDHELVERFERGARVLVRTLMPDLTVPSRRDAPHRVSLRQWRYAELLELALARTPDDALLRGALQRLYARDLIHGDTGRFRSTGEAERNEPATRLTRADLSWKGLGCALPELPVGPPSPAESVLLPAQGLAIIRRQRGMAFVALDYGNPGGGHGHPDRLNVLLAHGTTRWLDDMGAGSYTSADLFWYRSSLAHNAPLVDGRTQRSVSGELLAWDERGDAGWVSAQAGELAPGVTMRRSVIVMDGYLVDELQWSAEDPVAVDLPLHADGTFSPALPWQTTDLALPSDADAGFDFLHHVEAAAWPIGVSPVLHAARGTARATVRLLLPEGAMLWRADAPGASGEGTRRFHVVRAHAREGAIVAVWDWSGDVVRDVARDGSRLVVHLGGTDLHAHARSAEGWQVEMRTGSARSTLELRGRADLHRPERNEGAAVDAGSGPESNEPSSLAVDGPPGRSNRPAAAMALDGTPRHLALAAPDWRYTEDDWTTAGSPTADIALSTDHDALQIVVTVTKDTPTFAPQRSDNPLDNEHPDINSDGLQLHLHSALLGEARWIVVPDGAHGARITARTPAAQQLTLRAVSVAVTPTGWTATLSLALDPDTRARFHLAVLVNEIAPDRERRRGQLVMGGARDRRAYLVGDRHDLSTAPVFRFTDA